MPEDRLRAAAFGAEPGARVFPAGPAVPPADRWLQAVVLGGQGRYAAAARLLRTLLTDPATPREVAAHSAVTLASHLRQQGGHAAARELDARALRWSAAGPSPSGLADPDGIGPHAARVDAVVGLAADAVGLGDPATAQRLLAVARSEGHPSWRLRVREGWVRAELALLRGRAGDGVRPAEEALMRAGSAGSVRHVLKSRLVLGVVRATVHPDGAALVELDAVAAQACDAGLLPLHWPACLAGAEVADLLSRNVSESLPSANDGGSGPAPESPSDRMGGAARRRHAAAATMSVIYQVSGPVGRRLMGEPVCRVAEGGVTLLLHSELHHPHDECHSAQLSRMEGTKPP